MIDLLDVETPLREVAGEADRQRMRADRDAGAVGIVVDVYHVWWDAMLEREVGRARGRILGFHVYDWLVPTPRMLLGPARRRKSCP